MHYNVTSSLFIAAQPVGQMESTVTPQDEAFSQNSKMITQDRYVGTDGKHGKTLQKTQLTFRKTKKNTVKTRRPITTF